jgi:ubiquinol-cytochrome c reductase iron-sulfur subunit
MLSRSLARSVAPLVSARAAHTDKHMPDLQYFRKQTTNSTHPANSQFLTEELERKELDRHKSYVMTAALGSILVYSGGNLAWKVVSTLLPTRSVQALASVEIDIGGIPEGKTCLFKWRGKPIFIAHRTPEDITREDGVDVGALRHQEADADRCPNPEWMVVIGICTHLGCVPIANAGNFNGYFCPCHGSHYDASGRIRQGPAPLNLEVPPYKFMDENTILIG